MLLIFAGAGASYAVNKEQYPTTVEYFNRLPKEAKNDLFNLVHMDLKKKKNTIDIEEILFKYDEIGKFLDKALNPGDVIEWVLTRYLKQFGGQTVNHGVFNKLRNSLDQSRDVIWQQVYELYGKIPENRDDNHWRIIINYLENTMNSIKNSKMNPVDYRIFTTNYDLVIDNAFENYANVAENGFDANKAVGLNVNSTIKYFDFANLQPLRLFKLHGSVNWKHSTDNSHSTVTVEYSAPTYMGNHDKHALIYPGFKGEPDREPFQHLHSSFSKCLQKSDMWLIIGYAFRDEYINELFKEHKTKKTKIIIVDPSKPELPFEEDNNIGYIPAGFEEIPFPEIYKTLLDANPSEIRRLSGGKHNYSTFDGPQFRGDNT